MTAKIILHPTHPFMRSEHPSIWQGRDGRWNVKGRDFFGQKWDADFATEAEVKAFLAGLAAGKAFVENDDWRDDDELVEAFVSWGSRPRCA